MLEDWVMESQESASLRAWLSAVERFSNILEEQLEQAKARSLDAGEVRELEQLLLKVMRLWKRRLPQGPKERLKTGGKTRWVERKHVKTPQELTMD